MAQIQEWFPLLRKEQIRVFRLVMGYGNIFENKIQTSEMIEICNLKVLES